VNRDRGRLLIVDDNEMNRDMLSRRLGRKGFLVDTAKNGTQAIEMADGGNYDVILLDIIMPGINGIEVLSRLREKYNAGELPIIMVTAREEADYVVEALNKGANDYLTKPIDLSVTLARIDTQIRLGRLQRELDNARELAVQASTAKSDFLSNMSHEIRTPMNVIVGMAELLMESKLDPEQEHYTSVLQSASEALLDLINDILDLAKIEAGRLELSHVLFDVHALVEKARKLMEVRGREKGLLLKAFIASDVPRFIKGDPVRLRQVLINLLGNAIKFTESGGISVHVEKDPSAQDPALLRFSVSDTGIGISPDQKENIFEKFQRGDASVTREIQGTGLGLAICKRLTEMMGGSISVESELGKGSCFLVSAAFEIPDTEELLCTGPPIRVPGEAEAGHVSPRAALPDSVLESFPLRILLVDDALQNRVLIRSFLKGTSDHLEEAENGLIALEKFKQMKFDAILMDCQMPVMDGLTASKEIRKFEKDEGREPTPIIVLTANAMKENVLASFEAGCDAHLTKPLKKQALLTALQEHRSMKAARSGTNLEKEPRLGEHAGKDCDGDGKKVTVVVSRELEEIIPVFLECTYKDLQTIKDALTRGDFETVKRIGHTMKGSGISYGFPYLSEMGAEIENKTQLKNTEELRRLADEAFSYLEEMTITYDG
jgi:signal transduction histidine kinase/HPt (histidine-containing phosphotransfer) domain-containing protein